MEYSVTDGLGGNLMTPKSICIQDLNAAIAFAKQLKVNIAQGKYRLAIDGISDLLFVLGRALTCINRLEFIRGKKTIPSIAPIPTAKSKTAPARNRAECIRFVDLAISNFETAKRFVQQGRYEDAENAIAATLTGKILRCVNRLRP